MLRYADFYDIAVYANTNWGGGFNEKSIACYAYDYLCEFEASKENGVPTHTIKELAKSLAEDKSEEGKDWLYEMAKELGLIDMDFWDYMETDADIVSVFLTKSVERNWRNVELNGNDVLHFKAYLRDEGLSVQFLQSGPM